MKIIFSESEPFYESYTFNYAIYAESEGKDLSEIYHSGFLPYTGDTSLKQQRFYLCRSLRVKLRDFKLNSENRRIKRKFNEYEISRHKQDAQNLFGDANFLSFCRNYAAQKFHGRALSKDRLRYILNWHEDLKVWTYTLDDQLMGYVFAIEGNDFAHYWYSFYDLELSKNLPVGKYMMTNFIELASAENLKYVYLGTCYHKRSLYKARDYKSIEFFDGNKWKNDLSELKRRCKWDDKEKNVRADWLKIKDLEKQE